MKVLYGIEPPGKSNPDEVILGAGFISITASRKFGRDTRTSIEQALVTDFEISPEGKIMITANLPGRAGSSILTFNDIPEGKGGQ